MLWKQDAADSSAATPHTLSTASRYEAETPLGKTGRRPQFVIKLLKKLNFTAQGWIFIIKAVRHTLVDVNVCRTSVFLSLITS